MAGSVLIPPRLPPHAEQRKALENLRQLLARTGQHDIAQFAAIGHAVDAVTVLASLMVDPTVKPETRRACANDVLNRAYGMPLQPVKVEQTPAAVASEPGDQVTIEMDNAARQAEAQQDLLRWLKVPRHQWPPEIVERYGQEAAILEQMPGLF